MKSLIYLLIIEQGQESFGAYVPDLSGCVAVGETRKEVEQLIKEAIQLHIEAMKEDGEQVPEPNSKPIQVMVA